MVIDQIKNSKKVVLIEPPYKRKYPPLGLAKIATMVKQNGGEVYFQRKYQPNGEDLVCITSLFTYDSKKVLDTINQVKFLNPKVPIILGGVYASLMGRKIQEDYPDIQVFRNYSKELDMYPPDYSIDWQVEDKWKKYSFVFTTRGCANNCAYCAVWRIEDMWVNPNWESHIDMSKPYVMISDNNFTTTPIEHQKRVCDFLRKTKKKVVFDNGFDCKHITDEFLEIIKGVKFDRCGCRLAFDRIEEDGEFQEAIKKLINNGVAKGSLMSYCLFNFQDTPQEANYRMTECVKLGIRPYPQQYMPLNRLDREPLYIGKHWTKNLLRTFRFFWLMAGYYTKNNFEDWVKSQDKYILTEEDWEKWNLKN